MPFRPFQALRHRFRPARYQELQALLEVEECPGFILDLGGGPASFFASLYPRPQQVILAELEHALALQATARVPSLRVIVAKGEELPFSDGGIDVTVCNSVIEHVEDAAALAGEIRRVSSAYFVQTPNGRFPVELHSTLAIPFYRWIPWPALRRKLCRLFGGDFDYVESVSYLAEDEIVGLFPEAHIVRERFFGLTKSFYAVKLTGD